MRSKEGLVTDVAVVDHEDESEETESTGENHADDVAATESGEIPDDITTDNERGQHEVHQ